MRDRFAPESATLISNHSGPPSSQRMMRLVKTARAVQTALDDDCVAKTVLKPGNGLQLTPSLVRSPGFSRNLSAIAAAIPPEGGTTNLEYATSGLNSLARRSRKSEIRISKSEKTTAEKMRVKSPARPFMPQPKRFVPCVMPVGPSLRSLC